MLFEKTKQEGWLSGAFVGLVLFVMMVFVVTVSKFAGTSNFKNDSLIEIVAAIIIVPMILCVVTAILHPIPRDYKVFVDRDVILILEHGEEVARRRTSDFRRFRPSLLGPVNVMEFDEAPALEVKHFPPIKLFQIFRYIMEVQTGKRLNIFESLKMWFGLPLQ